MADNEMIQVQFQPTGKRVEIPLHGNLLDAARKAGIEITSTCGGEGSCGQCQVIVLNGSVSAPTDNETFIFSKVELASGRRLACETQARSDIIVEIPRESVITGQRLMVESSIEDIAVDPLVTAYPLHLNKPTLKDVRSDFTRVADALLEEQGLADLYAAPAVIRQLSDILRAQDWNITAYIRGSEVVGFGPPDAHPLGFCVDLGTTKIAASLVDLETGQVLVSTGVPNPQLGYGEDVISRINYVQRNPEGGAILAEKVQAALNAVLGELTTLAQVSRSQVVESCIAGNTVMIHLLLRLPVKQLATAPYVAAVSDAVDMRAEDIGLETAPGGHLYIPPSVSGFIGSDHIAMILALNFDRLDKVTLGIDIGTNTEIVIRKPGQPILGSASCASGPAFEGAHIREGMRAGSGAIEKVRILTDGLDLQTIQNEAPVGLCGSGIVDTIAELYRTNLINRHGTFQRDNPRVRVGKNGGEFLLVPAEASGTGRDIVIDQKDINEIQLAKGAIRAGLEIMMNVSETAPEEVEEVIVAGAFGTYLDIPHAASIGMFPTLPNAVFRQVGNAALVGAKWLLISKAARRRAYHIQRNTAHQELTNNPKFNRIFAQGMLFPILAQPSGKPDD